MATSNTVTATEELQRYSRNMKGLAQPVIDKTLPSEDVNNLRSTANDNAEEELFNYDIVENNEWVDVVGSEEMPEENYQENYRLATGTGPLGAARVNIRQRILDVGTAAAAKASQAPTIMRTCVDSQTERLAEEFGRATVTETVVDVLQRYPLLERWRLAFFRGRDRGGQDVEGASTRAGAETSESGRLVVGEETPFCLGEEEVEGAPAEKDAA